MRKLITFAGCLLIAGSCFICGGGCSTTPAGKATQVEGAVIPAVNAAMGSWKAYTDTGKATQAQINQVKTAYNAYYTAQLAAEAVLLKLVNNQAGNQPSASDIADANNAVAQAESALLTTINSFIK